jgi:hypothetical protein
MTNSIKLSVVEGSVLAAQNRIRGTSQSRSDGMVSGVVSLSPGSVDKLIAEPEVVGTATSGVCNEHESVLAFMLWITQ